MAPTKAAMLLACTTHDSHRGIIIRIQPFTKRYREELVRSSSRFSPRAGTRKLVPRHLPQDAEVMRPLPYVTLLVEYPPQDIPP